MFFVLSFFPDLYLVLSEVNINSYLVTPEEPLFFLFPFF